MITRKRFQTEDFKELFNLMCQVDVTFENAEGYSAWLRGRQLMDNMLNFANMAEIDQRPEIEKLWNDYIDSRFESDIAPIFHWNPNWWK